VNKDLYMILREVRQGGCHLIVFSQSQQCQIGNIKHMNCKLRLNISLTSHHQLVTCWANAYR